MEAPLVGGAIGVTITGGSTFAMLWTEGELIVRIKEHYLPQEYWRFVSYQRGGLCSDYQCDAYIGADNCTHFKQTPKNPDGTLKEDETIYI